MKKILCIILCLIICLFSVVIADAAPQFLTGDADGDGIISASDARSALRYSVYLDNPSFPYLFAADVNADNYITAEDARLILRATVGLGNADDRYAAGMTGATLVGITYKGYRIYRLNGQYYIDGLLIANKTYALTSSYAPGDLTSTCENAYYSMKNAAANAGVSLWIVSDYRSYDTQKRIYNNYVAEDGQTEADTYSARPGHSEHQTGLAMDLNSLSDDFGTTTAGKWLAANCWKYGFILRYPYGKDSKTGYTYEPWHFRYVGLNAAKKIAASGLSLEEYYGITSSYDYY